MSEEAPNAPPEAPAPPAENIIKKATHAVRDVITGSFRGGAITSSFRGSAASEDTSPPVDGDDKPRTTADRRSTVRRRSIFLSVPAPKSNVQLRLHEDLFEHTNTGDDIPIGSVEGTPFYNLQIRGKLFDGNEIVLEDGSNDKVVAVVERKYTNVGYDYRLYSQRPVTPHQPPSDLLKYNTTLYDFAMVDQKPDGSLHVIKEGETKAKYTLETKGDAHVIKKLGTTVATLSPSEGEFYQLDLNEGVDPCLLICLAAIADEVSKRNF